MMWNGGISVAGVLILFVLMTLIVVVVVAVVLATRTSGGGGGSSSALRILEERYARGEIERDEYLQRRGDLLG